MQETQELELYIRLKKGTDEKIDFLKMCFDPDNVLDEIRVMWQHFQQNAVYMSLTVVFDYRLIVWSIKAD